MDANRNAHSVIIPNPRCGGFMKFARRTFEKFQQFREQAFCPDVRLIANDKTEFPAHRIALAAQSDFFYDLFKTSCYSTSENKSTESINGHQCAQILTVNLENFDRASIRRMLNFIYSGDLSSSLDETEKSDLRHLAKTLKIVGLETKLSDMSPKVTDGDASKKNQSDQQAPGNSGAKTFDPQINENENNVAKLKNSCVLPIVKISEMTKNGKNQADFDFSQIAGSSKDAETMSQSDLPIRKRRIVEEDLLLAAATVSRSGNEEENQLPIEDQLLPEPEKVVDDLALLVNDGPESSLGMNAAPNKITVDQDTGWCRNRKYIENTGDGFMCLICKKTYLRYNSTSYHVTIYHRNPPIKCDEDGCTFATREARYIHFHKFYRHHIPLPDNIEVDSRQCPFCPHIAKSPAMLEKHITRHLPDCIRVGKTYHCQVCNEELSSKTELIQHMWIHQEQKTYPCDKCQYIGRSAANLRQHQSIKHSSSDADLLSVKLKCNDCEYQSSSDISFIAHRRRAHGSSMPMSTNGFDDPDERDIGSSSKSPIESIVTPPTGTALIKENRVEMEIGQSGEKDFFK